MYDTLKNSKEMLQEFERILDITMLIKDFTSWNDYTNPIRVPTFWMVGITLKTTCMGER